MDRLKKEFQDYLYVTCLKATIKENRAFSLEEAQNINSCYCKMAKAYGIIEKTHDQISGFKSSRIISNI